MVWAFTLMSSAFSDGEMIPELYTVDGTDISPPLEWSNPPEGTRSFALICDDPDAPAGTWVHWVIYNIDADVNQLEAGILPDPELFEGMLQGKNSWGRIGYGGPAPPSGTHRYFFRIYALSATLDMQAGVTKAELLTAMEGFVLDEASLMGRYRRK
ncbi:YbhB/YbcL family Raf kinase inhibitor-like protein [Candidatus Fermentibacterales bacterium]|nr:YbhB/YbcL family Raf kinase inhibitor-like protein [Candidatus Fermentibacterales bacterium]